MKFVTSAKNILGFMLKNEGDKKKLSTVILPSFFIHFIAGLLYVLTVLVLTRKLGAREYGVLTYSFTVISLIISLLLGGINVMAVREPPALLSKGQTGLWKGFYRWSSRIVIVVSILVPLLIAACILFARYYLHLFTSSLYTTPILCALAAFPFYALMNYYSAWLRGQHKTVLSFLPDNIIKPAFFLIVLVCFFHFNLWNAIWIRDLSFLAGSIFAIATFYRTTKMSSITPEYDIPAWKTSLKSFFLLAALVSISSRVDILMLGFFRDASQVGIYSGADMLATKIVIFQTLMNQISVASISRLHTLNDKKKLQSMMTKITRGVAIVSIPFFIVIILFNKWILSFLGPAFVQGESALIILCTGQLISLAFGPVGNFAVTTKNEKINIVFVILKMGIAILINLILTPIWGINGTAIATAASLVFWNAGMFITVKKRTGISTWIFG